MNEKSNYATLKITMDSNRMFITLPETDGVEHVKFYNQHHDLLTYEGMNYYSAAKQHRAWMLETL